jgi:hypothetical protein
MEKEAERFKCHPCCLIIRGDLLTEDGACPVCGRKPEKMCVLDHKCRCPETINSGIFYCTECGKSTCPCGSHDVAVVSRVTGLEMKMRSYFHRNLSTVAGWNQSKQAELRDRHRYSIE